MKFKEMLQMLKEDVWKEKSQKGSHLQLEHPAKPVKVTLPAHGRDITKAPNLIQF